MSSDLVVKKKNETEAVCYATLSTGIHFPSYINIACNADIATVLTYCFLVTLANLPADARICPLYFVCSLPFEYNCPKQMN